jgi:hypothetical protein
MHLTLIYIFLSESLIKHTIEMKAGAICPGMALGKGEVCLTSKLGLIPKNFRTLIILKGLKQNNNNNNNITLYRKLKRLIYFKQTF